MPLQANADTRLLSSNLPLAEADISAADLDWHSEGQRESEPSEEWRRWLFDPGSLTQSLIEKSDGDFAVQLLSEQWQTVEEPRTRSCFGPLKEDHRFWSRKVLLRGGGEPWVLAHTLIPQYSLFSPLKRVLELNEKPLGEYLFSHPDLIRSGMDITPFAADSWGRRSLFYLFQKPVMVAEFFLPTILG